MCSLFIVILFLIGLFYTEYLTGIHHRDLLLEEELEIARMRSVVYKNQIDREDRIRSMYHDMKNHLLVLKNNALKPDEYAGYLSELEEKMKNDPELAKSVMAKVEGFIAEQDIMNPNPRKGYLIALDENGDIAHACVTSEKMSVSSAEFIEARKAREEKHAEYERLAEESALKRKLMEQEADERYYRRQECF